MKKFSLRALATALILTAVAANAQSRRTSAAGSGLHAVSGAFGFYSPGAATYVGKTAAGQDNIASPRASGFFGIGGDYEYSAASDFTLGGFFRYYSTSDSINSGGASTEEKNSAWVISTMARVYLPTDNFLPYIGAGLGLIGVNLEHTTAGRTDEYDPSATLGFNMAIGLLYKVNDQVSVGVENLRVYALGEKVNGNPVNDFMFKGRFVF